MRLCQVKIFFMPHAALLAADGQISLRSICPTRHPGWGTENLRIFLVALASLGNNEKSLIFLVASLRSATIPRLVCARAACGGEAAAVARWEDKNFKDSS